ncbi:NAD(P)-binding protein [Lophiostoma macrostomum CBS 122681]|uniref:NAD(P)-binding protein n=1 Tax=Lophiostoma macrostomum CBS 122681 TaxID=1314788 RepID=A0A6A6TI64_9PLEO|nr:NAD(P)-binding protein [Lophiostoma macrostomum CBS 122681]
MTTHPEFNDHTEALDVAKVFADNIRGRTVLVTGANRQGIGFATLEAFASQSPGYLILAGRTPSKIQESINDLKERFPKVDYRALEINLSDQTAVRSAARELLSWSDIPTIDIVVNNAGVMLSGTPERTLSVDGIELHFATNHIGHFLFTCLIIPKLIKAASASDTKGTTRIVNVTSGSPTLCSMRWSDLNFEKLNKDLPEVEQPNYQLHNMWGVEDAENKSYIPLEGYNQSKVANVLFAIASNKRLYDKYGILSNAVHPGVIRTELGRYGSPEHRDAIKKMSEAGVFTWRSQGAGGATNLVAALDPRLGPGESRDGKENYGVFLADCQVSGDAHPLAVASSEAKKLWELSERLVKEQFSL